MMEVLATVAAITFAFLVGILLFGWIWSMTQPYPEDFPTEEVKEEQIPGG